VASGERSRARPLIAKWRKANSLADQSTMHLISGERAMRRASLIGVIATITALSLASCSSSDPPSTEPTPTISVTNTSPVPTPTVPAYLATYTVDEREAFSDAVEGVRHQLGVVARVNERGKADARARRLLRSVDFDTQFSADWRVLEGFFTNRFHTVGVTELVSAEPTRIDVSADQGASVTLKACVDSSPVRVFNQAGDEIEVAGRRGPGPVTLQVDRFPNEPWKVSEWKGHTGSC
jgi:hypothetical protein